MKNQQTHNAIQEYIRACQGAIANLQALIEVLNRLDRGEPVSLNDALPLFAAIGKDGAQLTSVVKRYPFRDLIQARIKR